MLIAILGESCTGKSTIAKALSETLGATIYTGKDYLRLAKGESEAKRAFAALLAQSVCGAEALIYVISERELLPLLPDGAFRVLVTAELHTIMERFAQRTGGVLPPPIAAMLKAKHGMFDRERHDLRVKSGDESVDAVCARIVSGLRT